MSKQEQRTTLMLREDDAEELREHLSRGHAGDAPSQIRVESLLGTAGRAGELVLAYHEELAASQAREQALREEVERLREERDEARVEAEDAVTLLDQHLEHHPWSTVPLLWLRGEQELHCSDDAPDHDEQEKDGEGCG